MFEFLVTTVLVGVLVALKKLFSRLAALSHESDVLKRRLDSMRQDLTGVTVALRANATGETLPGEGRRVNLGAILDLDRRLNELSERLKGPIETPGESGAIDRESQVHPSLPPLPSEEAMPPSTAKETEPFVPESAPPILVPDANKTLPPPVPVLLPQQPHRPQSPQQDLQPVFDWESFTGVKLFAWLGGVALFLGAAFFVKYSIEHSLISPMLRIILGLLAGSGLLAGGMWMRRQGYETTVHTLCASGIAILYVDIFAAHAFYDFIPPAAAFVLMALVTLAAFLLAVRLDGRYIAVLGLVGGFLTPPLLSTGVDRPLGLFSYVALLDAGLIAIAWHKRWVFLVSMSAVGTLAMQLGWAEKFFEVSKALTGCSIFLLFPLFYLAVLIAAGRRKLNDRWVEGPGFVLPLVSMGFAAYMLGFAELGARPGLVFSFVFLLGSALTGTALLRPDYRPVHAIGGSLAFLMLVYWTVDALTLELLPWALGFYLLFAALHAAFPIALQRLQPESRPVAWASVFPVLMLLPMLIAIGRDLAYSLLIWPALFAVNGVVLLAAIAPTAVWTVAIALLLTLSSAALWLNQSPGIAALPGFLGIVALSTLFFFAIGVFLSRRRPAVQEPGSAPAPAYLQHLPALSAVLPFLLLILASAELPLAQPAPIFGLALLLSVLLLGLVYYRQADVVFPVAAGSVALLLYAWHTDHFDASRPMLALPWYLFFSLCFFVFPFLFHKRLQERRIPWVAAALSAPITLVQNKFLRGAWSEVRRQE